MVDVRPFARLATTQNTEVPLTEVERFVRGKRSTSVRGWSVYFNRLAVLNRVVVKP